MPHNFLIVANLLGVQGSVRQWLLFYWQNNKIFARTDIDIDHGIPSIQSFSKDFGSTVAFRAAGKGNPIFELIYKNQPTDSEVASLIHNLERI